MIKVYQTIIDSKNGNCWQAVIASMLGLPLESVPHFVSLKNPFKAQDKFLLKHGYVNVKQMFNPRRLKHFGPDQFLEISHFTGIDGLFKACVYSPKFFTAEKMCSDNEPIHAVVINRNFEIVHDPNPEYAKIKSYPLTDVLGYNGIISFDCITKA